VLVPVFSYFCVSKRRNESQTSYFSRHEDEVQSRDGGGPGAGHTIGWRGSSLAAPPGGVGPLVHPLTSPFCLHILSEAKTLNRWASIHEKFRSAAAIKDQFWGTKVSVPAPCRDGELPWSHLHRLHCHLHRRCCLP
jgi:hypothetical protein